MKKGLLSLLLAVVCLSLCACDTISTVYDSAFDTMSDAFNQIIETESGNAIVNSSSSIIVSHSDETKIDDKTLLESCKGKPLVIFMEKAKQLGYKITYLADGVDFTDFIDSMKEDYVTGDLIINTNEKTATVDLVLASSIELKTKEAALKKKLELYSSWVAVKEYGTDNYGKSFELNYVAGKISESLYDDNTWFLKAECKINGLKKICEAKVTGTTNNPKVVFFDIY